MSYLSIINSKTDNFNKTITVDGDKSISIRWVLLASLSNGTSKAKNLLLSEDVLATIKAVNKLGIKSELKNKNCKIYGRGISGYKYKKNLTINAQNSGTLGRLLLGFLINTPYPIKLVGDSSLSKRDFKRITDPLSKFGAKFKLKNNMNLPLTIQGLSNPKAIKYIEKKGSAQVKSSIIFAGMRSNGTTIIKAKNSRTHTEVMCKNLSLPVRVRRKKNYDEISVEKVRKIKKLNYNIPSDISSASFFIVLTALSQNSQLIIKNVNINLSRIGIIKILEKMGVKITLQNKKNYKGEIISDIKIKSSPKLKSINCPAKLNSEAIDEFLLIFLCAAKAKGVSYFRDLEELNKKESPRLIWGSRILNKMGVKNIMTKNSIKIYGNPNLKINKKIIIKNYLKDHRVFMTSVIAALSFGGVWNIANPESIKTSFPNFLRIINELKNK